MGVRKCVQLMIFLRTKAFGYADKLDLRATYIELVGAIRIWTVAVKGTGVLDWKLSDGTRLQGRVHPVWREGPIGCLLSRHLTLNPPQRPRQRRNLQSKVRGGGLNPGSTQVRTLGLDQRGGAGRISTSRTWSSTQVQPQVATHGSQYLYPGILIYSSTQVLAQFEPR